MTARNIKKNLAGAEDLLIGVGVESQLRGESLYPVHKLDIYVPTTSIEEMKKSSLYYMRLYLSSTVYKDYYRDESASTGIEAEVGGYWVEVDKAVVSQIPTSSTSLGEAGQMAADADFVYFCVAKDTWKRVALTSW